jgi:phosphate transport system permease protein
MNTALAAIPRIDSRRGHLRRRSTNYFMLALCGIVTILALIPLFWIIGYVIYRGSASINLEFFTQIPRPLGALGGGVAHAIEGTLILTIMATIFAIPPGVLAAFYAARNPNTPLGIAVRFGTDVLAGVPSIVVGLFGYALFVKPQGHYSALAGGLSLAILMLPTIIRTTEEMIKLVPHSLREGSLALGAPEWKTALQVILPAAGNGVITGFLLGIARASGETAPLLFTALGNERFELGSIIQSGIQNGQDIFTIFGRIFDSPIDSLALTLYKYSQQPFPERVNQAWGVALVLMILVLGFNILARVWVLVRTNQMRK